MHYTLHIALTHSYIQRHSIVYFIPINTIDRSLVLHFIWWKISNGFTCALLKNVSVLFVNINYGHSLECLTNTEINTRALDPYDRRPAVNTHFAYHSLPINTFFINNQHCFIIIFVFVQYSWTRSVNGSSVSLKIHHISKMLSFTAFARYLL